MSEPVFRGSKVETFRIGAFCPKDGTELKFGGYILTSSPPKYPHKCPECDYKVNLPTSYPTTEFRVA
jgi:hypothetical protein